jgi:hypothetical protein
MVKFSASTLGKITEEGAEAGKGALVGTGLGIGITGIMTGASGSVDAKQLSGDIIGAGAQELLEYGLKKAFSKQATGILAQQASSAAVKQAAETVGTQIAKQAASTGIRTTITTAAKSAATTAAKTAMSMAGGPIGLALLLISLTLGFLDMFWNPWKNYFNKDLQEMIDQFNQLATQQFKLQGATYPITLKPNIKPETEQEQIEFTKDLIQYLKDRNLILPEEAFKQLTKRLDDYEQFRMHKVQLSEAHIAILQGTASQFQAQEQASNWQQIKDITEASQLKNKISDKMSHYLFISLTQEDIQTNRTQLLLYTALLYKKGIILPPSQRSIFTDIIQYFQIYWFRIFFYLSIISIIFSILLYTFN